MLPFDSASENSSSGSVNSDRATFSFPWEASTFSWRLTDDGTSNSIPVKNIIAIIPVHRDLPNDYKLLFVECDLPSEDANPEEHTLYKSLLIVNPPSRCIHLFSPPSSSCWNLRSDSPGSNEFPNLHVIVSTGSGHGKSEIVFNNILKPFLVEMGCTSWKHYTTTSPQTITEIAQNILLPAANQGIRQHIVLLSGDGGPHDILNALLTSPNSPAEGNTSYVKPSIALLPLGTGNALANSTDILADSTMGLSSLIRGHPKQLPFFRVTLSSQEAINPTPPDLSNDQTMSAPYSETVYGAVVCSWGLHASLVADSDTPEYRQHGATRFQMAAKEALFPSDGGPPHAYKAIISLQIRNEQGELEWRNVERSEHAYVLATMVSQLEKRFLISPESKPMDGRLRVVHFGPMSGKETTQIMGLAYAGGKHVQNPAIGYDEVEAIRLEFDGREENNKWRRICVDGKILTIGKHGIVEVRRETRDVLDLVNLPR